MILAAHHIVSIVSNYYDLPAKALLSKRSRQREPFKRRIARLTCMYFLREVVGLDPYQAGKELNIISRDTVKRYMLIADPLEDIKPLQRIINNYISACN